MSPLAFPLRAAPGTFHGETDARRAYADWLEHDWQAVAGLLEFTLEAGLVDGEAVAVALDANDGGDARPLYGLATTALRAIGDYLNAQVADLVDPALHPALLIGMEGREEGDGAIHLVGEGAALVCNRLPFLTLHPDLARLCYRVCILMSQTLGIDITRGWQPDLFWTVEERLDAFLAVPAAVRNDPDAFHTACVEESQECGLLAWGTESVADAVDLAAELASWVDVRDRWQAFVKRQHRRRPLTVAQVDAKAARLVAYLERGDAHPVDLAWARWLRLVCARLRAAVGRSPAAPTAEDEGAWALDWLIQLDPGLPWFGDALQDTLDQVAQTGERMIASYPFVAGGARSILDALTNAATAMGLILAAPSCAEVEDAAH
ncbi:hypothetical protein [Candidatus Thiodictyon syntrophicum]|uniref:PRTRC system protein F n=1 Tax=Candidatus Thiodictyon syntrophicum TaxID=1166950 RepID=A0A2K8UHV8_9GAMM|nr:hypothetical protein [Candidatus Thiodictyon syntrophicum]AUB85138.1 hypothetical protein THSYN_29895 [Candidatus Thiodictyon syntrophicum]